MLKYEKMREYLYSKLGCKIFDLFDQGGSLKYVRFQTQKGVDCLLKITRPMSYPAGHSKLVQLIPYDDSKEDTPTFDYFVTNDLALVKKIPSSVSPRGYVSFLKKLNPSLQATTLYSVAVITSEYLVVVDDNDDTRDTRDTRIYHVKDVNLPHGQRVQMLIVMSLEAVVERNITNESFRVYDHILSILNDDTATFRTQLKNVLTKCSSMKILSEKVPQLERINPIDLNIGLSESTKALLLASDALEKLN